MDKFLNYMKLNGEEEDEYYDDDYLDEEDDEPAPPPRRNSSKIRDMEDYEDERMSASRRQQTSSGKITPIKQATSRRVAGSGSMEVCVIKPTSVEDAREITETLLANRTVVLNLESTNKDIARRLLDFLSGVAYANEGKIKKVAISTYIITPYNVDILGDLIDELENNGLYL